MLIRTLNKCIKQDYPVTIGDYASALQDEKFFRQLGRVCKLKNFIVQSNFIKILYRYFNGR